MPTHVPAPAQVAKSFSAALPLEGGALLLLAMQYQYSTSFERRSMLRQAVVWAFPRRAKRLLWHAHRFAGGAWSPSHNGTGVEWTKLRFFDEAAIVRRIEVFEARASLCTPTLSLYKYDCASK